MAVLRQCLDRPMKVVLVVVLMLACASGVFGAEPDKAGLPGHCAICGEQIAERNAVGQLLKQSNYRELTCATSAEHTMRIAVCSYHADDRQHRAQQLTALWAGVRRGWASEMQTWPAARQAKYWAHYEGVRIARCDN